MLVKTKKFVILVCLGLIIAGCDDALTSNPKTSAKEDYWSITAAGTPRFVYMNNQYKEVALATNTDPGKTLVFIEKNALANDAVIIAETSSGDVDDTVRIINAANNTVVSLFFHKGQNLPWMIELYDGTKQIEARVRNYDYVFKKFTLTVLDQDDQEQTTLENLYLNIIAHNMDAALDVQKTRLKNIYTALGIYESVGRYVSRNKGYSAGLSPFFYDKSIISFAIAAHNVDVITGADSIAVTENGRSGLVNAIPDIFTSGSSQPSKPTAPPQLSVTIKKDGNQIKPETVYYLPNGGDEIVLDFAFNDNFQNNLNVYAGWYAPDDIIYLTLKGLNAQFFTFTQNDGSPLGSFTKNYTVKITRKFNKGNGYDPGTVDMVIFFGQNTAVNGKSDGTSFVEQGTAASVSPNSVYAIHLSNREKEGS